MAVALGRSRGARGHVHGAIAGRPRRWHSCACGFGRIVAAGAGQWDLLVNTTPVGTAPRIDESPLPDGPFDGALVYDLVYNPPMTRLLRDAAEAGCRTIGGLDMLVAQAQAQFHWWTGSRARRHGHEAAAHAAAPSRGRPRTAGAASLSN